MALHLFSRMTEMKFSGSLNSICSNCGRAISFNLTDVIAGSARYTWKKNLEIELDVTR